MNLTEQIYAQVLTLAGETDGQQRSLLHVLSAGAASALASGLRQESAEQAREILVTAGSLYALAAFLETDESRTVERFTAGDVTVRRQAGADGARVLREQADRMMAPWRADRFAFRRV